MKKSYVAFIAIILGLSMAVLSSYTKKIDHKNEDLIVRYIQGGVWSEEDESLDDALSNSGCPDSNGAVCAQFYDVNNLNIVGGEVQSIKFISGSTPYPPNDELRYTP